MKSLLLFLKNSDLFWLVKKIDFDLSKYQICFGWYVEKGGFWR